MIGIEIAGAVRDSETNDEGAHLVSGYCEWTLRDFRLDPSYPPFAKLLQSLPVLFLHPRYTPPAHDWARADEFGLGRDFFTTVVSRGSRYFFRGGWLPSRAQRRSLYW